jgi:SPP1 gp7 family putative phage head morphogenesis protein
LVFNALEDAIKNGRELVVPKNPHKSNPIIPPLVSEEALKWLKTRMGWAAAEIGDTLERDLEAELETGFKNGESITQVAARIDEFFADPVRANRIARTEIISASNFGAVEGYKEVGVEKVEFYTAMDERTCELCDTYHEQIFGIGEGMTPPLHPNCRCVLLPVVE